MGVASEVSTVEGSIEIRDGELRIGPGSEAADGADLNVERADVGGDELPRRFETLPERLGRFGERTCCEGALKLDCLHFCCANLDTAGSKGPLAGQLVSLVDLQGSAREQSGEPIGWGGEGERVVEGGIEAIGLTAEPGGFRGSGGNLEL